jgi:hypothetical protein
MKSSEEIATINLKKLSVSVYKSDLSLAKKRVKHTPIGKLANQLKNDRDK